MPHKFRFLYLKSVETRRNFLYCGVVYYPSSPTTSFFSNYIILNIMFGIRNKNKQNDESKRQFLLIALPYCSHCLILIVRTLKGRNE